ncbi:TPA: helix-turn-helix domain-containing protein [Klebsiella pneumoniae]
MAYTEKTEASAKNRDRIFMSSGINCFGARLKKAMNGMSNSELGRKSGMSETTIRKYLRGDIYPGIDSAALVAEACGVSLVWLICGIEQKDEISNIDSKSHTDSILEAIIKRLPEEQGQQLADAIIIHGVAGIISAINSAHDVSGFLKLPESERERILRLYNQVKGGDVETGGIITTPSPSKNDKKAG